MNKTVVYIHGAGGSAEEAGHYIPLFENYNVVGFDYRSSTPWEAAVEFPKYFDAVCKNGKAVIVANSIGAFFAMSALSEKYIEKAYFISPVVDMKNLIENMMKVENISYEELKNKGEITTSSGQTLSFEYLSYVTGHPLIWDVPTDILYGEKDNLTSFETVSRFAEKTGATLTVMKNGEHWFHTEEQMLFLDNWIKKDIKS